MCSQDVCTEIFVNSQSALNNSPTEKHSKNAQVDQIAFRREERHQKYSENFLPGHFLIRKIYTFFTKKFKFMILVYLMKINNDYKYIHTVEYILESKICSVIVKIIFEDQWKRETFINELTVFRYLTKIFCVADFLFTYMFLSVIKYFYFSALPVHYQKYPFSMFLGPSS
jgi:hypothetical protein